MFGTYKEKDVTLLLKDITGLVEPLGTAEREICIQNGTHYSEMLPLEEEPSVAYLNIYHDALKRYSKITAAAVASVAEKIWTEKGANAVLVSLARAGTPVGILIKHYVAQKYHINLPHYSISIIRGRGIDHNAMQYILSQHNPTSIQFIDGWTGKGAIQRELNQSMQAYPMVSAGLAVLSDPAHIAEKYGTRDDFLIANSCLNATVSGLLSRTFYRSDIIGSNDFHGAVFYHDLVSQDLTYQFINTIKQHFSQHLQPIDTPSVTTKSAIEEVKEICHTFKIHTINFVKPSIGETTRVLLRRMPWKILVHSLHDEEHLGHIYQLAKEKGIKVIEYPLENYRACGLIQSIADS